MESEKSFRKKIPFSLKRLLVQIAAFGFCNPKMQNFFSGKIYTGKWKEFCAPGLNCYSCPAAIFACPVGAAQAVASSPHFSFSFYAAGIALALGVFLGRGICAFLCPFGFLQELLEKIPSKKFRLPKIFRFLKYAVLLIFVLILPVASKGKIGTGEPAFCKYICPAGTLEGGVPLLAFHAQLRNAAGALFFAKVLILAAILFLCVFCYRFFCKALCPLGAVYGLLNKASFFHIKTDFSKCANCGACEAACKMDCSPIKNARSAECILCGKCAQVCKQGALRLCFL